MECLASVFVIVKIKIIDKKTEWWLSVRMMECKYTRNYYYLEKFLFNDYYSIFIILSRFVL